MLLHWPGGSTLQLAVSRVCITCHHVLSSSSFFQGNHLYGKPGKMSGISVKVRAMSGSVRGKCCPEKWPKTVYFLLAAYLCPFLTLLTICISFWFRIVHRCIPTPTTDNNTSTSMIWVTLNMGKSATNHQEIVREFHIVWRVGGHPVIGV